MNMNIDFSEIETDEERVQFLNGMYELIRDGEIPVELINKSLANFYPANAWLIVTLETVEKLNVDLKTDYKIWEAEKRDEARGILESEAIEKAQGKKPDKPSAGDIDAKMIVDNKEEYKEWQSRLNEIQRLEGFYRRLSDAWDTAGKMLINISQNARSDLMAIRVEKKANEDIKQEELVTRHPTRVPLQ